MFVLLFSGKHAHKSKLFTNWNKVLKTYLPISICNKEIKIRILVKSSSRFNHKICREI